MSFIKKTIENRLVQFPRRYKLNKVNGLQDTYDLEPITGDVTSIGTPVDKALLQRYEDTLDEQQTAIGNKLDKSGNSKDNTVTFAEATAEANIISGETHETIFGKIQKKFNAIATSLYGKAPTNHANPSDLYGLSTPDYYGHARVWNGLDATSVSGAIALHANQGKALNDKIENNKYSFMNNGGLVVTFNNSAVSSITQPTLNTWVILSNYVWSNSMTQTALSWNTLTFNTDSICSLYYNAMGNIAFNLKLEIDINGATYVGPSKFYSKTLPSGGEYIHLTDYVFDYNILPKFIDNSPLRFRWMFYFTTVPNTGAAHITANLLTQWTFSGTQYRVAGLIS